jgi:hypothetical protein
LDGALSCRQIPFPAEFCGPGDKRTRGGAALAQFWTDDSSQLVADCFTLTPGPAEPDARAAEQRAATHLFCRDLFNRGFQGLPYEGEACAPLFAAEAFTLLADGEQRPAEPPAGCLPVLREEAILPDCEQPGPPLGAYAADGSLFDIAIPGAGYLGADFRP